MSTVLCDAFWAPLSFIFHQGVDEGEQFTHACGDDDFKRFVKSFQAFSECLDDGIEAHGRKCGHVKRAAHGSASAPDGTLALERTTFIRIRSQSGDGGDFLPVEFTDFRHQRNEGCAGGAADAGNTLKDGIDFLPVFVGLDELAGVIINVFEFFIEDFDDAVNAFSDLFVDGLFEAVFLGSAHGHELLSARDEVVEELFFLCGRGRDAGLSNLCKTGEDQGIDGVCFGQFSDATCEVSNLAWIDNGDRQSGQKKSGDEAVLIRARRFNDNQRGLEWNEQGADFVQALFVVIEGGRSPGRQEAQIEPLFGNINADENGSGGSGHRQYPFLRMRTRRRQKRSTVLAAVRVKT